MEKRMTIFENLRDAFPLAYSEAPCGICYMPAQGWSIYRLTDGAPLNGEPEFIIARRGVIPVALNDHAALALLSLIMNEHVR